MRVTTSMLLLSLLLAAGCKSSIDRLDQAQVAYEGGNANDAIAMLEDGDTTDYPIANFLAFLQVRQAYYEHAPSGYERANAVLDAMVMPEQRAPVIKQYVDLIRFSALANAGRTEEADSVLSIYCAQSIEPLSRRYCLRAPLAEVMLMLSEMPGGKERRAYREYLEIVQAAYIRTYGWDPRRQLPNDPRPPAQI